MTEKTGALISGKPEKKKSTIIDYNESIKAKCLRTGCENLCTSYVDVCNGCANEAKQTGCSWEELPSLIKPKTYLSSDIDARIKFYDTYSKIKGKDIPVWLWKCWNKHDDFNNWLFFFCFGNMSEDFQEKIKRLEK